MPPIVKYFLRRLIAIPISLVLITMVLYGFMMLTPPEERASLFLPRRSDRLTTERLQRLTQEIIKEKGLDKPFPVQYVSWATSLLKGEWGYSPLLQSDVLPLLLRRSAPTLELTLITMLVFIPTGLWSGLRAGRRPNGRFDTLFRFTAFTSLSVPQFIIGIFLLNIFYIGLHWFPPERMSLGISSIISSESYIPFTGFLTVDGILNGRLDVTWDAIRHLILPVISLGLLNWAVLARIARVSTMEEFHKEHIIAAKARGIPENRLVNKHILRTIISPSLTSSALGATTLFTGAIVIEHTFSLKGISALMESINAIPDVTSVMGFAVFCILCVLGIMFILDVVQAIVDPRYRDGVLEK